MMTFLLQEMAHEVKFWRDQMDEDEGEGTCSPISDDASALLAGAGYDTEDLLLECLSVTERAYPSVHTSKCDWHVHEDGSRCE